MNWHGEMHTVSADPSGDDIPLFLRDDDEHTRGGALGGSQAGTHSASTKAVSAPLWVAVQEVEKKRESHSHLPSHTATRPLLNELGDGDNERGGTDHMDHAFAASAAVALRLTGESRHDWCLTRQRILGKGSYGCATLYRQDDGVTQSDAVEADKQCDVNDNNTISSTTRRSCGASSAAPLSWAPVSPSQRACVVVKDFNVQTMNDSAEERAAARREADILRACACHPNVVGFVDFCDDSERHKMIYLLLEYCAGGDLGAWIKTMRHAQCLLPESFVASVLIQVAVALYTLHTEHHVLHRDIKPHNIFVCASTTDPTHNTHNTNDGDNNNNNHNMCDDAAHISKSPPVTHSTHTSLHCSSHPSSPLPPVRNADNVLCVRDNYHSGDVWSWLAQGSRPLRVCVGDLGIAAQLNGAAGEAREACGSPYYMSPEMYAEKPYSTSTDVWSLGVVLYELMALERPFAATTAPALSRQVMQGTHTMLSELQTSHRPWTASAKGTAAHGGDSALRVQQEKHDKSHRCSSARLGAHTRTRTRTRALPYSSRLMELVESMLTVAPTARFTLRRVLRSAYVQENLCHVPLSVRRTRVYVELFGPATDVTGDDGDGDGCDAAEDEAWNARYADDDFE